MDNTKKRKAIIMGATSGIGKEMVEVLTSSGWEVGIAGRRMDILQKIQSQNLNVLATECIDITRSDSPSLLLKLIGKLGGMDLYFHSSGIGYQNRDLEIEKEIMTVETNVVGMTRMVSTAFNYFVSHPDSSGMIGVISSIARTKGLGPAPSYSSSKRYVSNYLESLQQLIHIRDIRNLKICDIRPGFVRTPLLNDGNKYPMQLDVSRVAKSIYKSLKRGKSTATIDWRYRLLVFLWRQIPHWLWVRIKI